MSNIYSELKERGFIKQETAPVQVFDTKTHKLVETLAVGQLLNDTKVTFYVGFDPTADSLHVGHLMPIMAMAHLQRAGHVPICIIGGGTTMIGDPSGKTEMRQMLTKEDIDKNGEAILEELKRYIDFKEGAGLFLNNADWLLPLNYIEFLRDIGKHFRVNEMIKAEAYRQRLEREEGLSFIEFNYQLLQAYDFLKLYEKYGCTLQIGGDDQWSNILAGVDLVRKVKQGYAHALTFPLIITARGQKMGKTEKGAVWLDNKKTSPYEYYQFWINTDDRDVEKFLKFFTFLSQGKIADLCAKGGEDLQNAKKVLAYEATKITHGEEEAKKAEDTSNKLFGKEGGDLSNAPSITISKNDVDNLKLVDVLVMVGFSSSKTEATKLIKSGGVYVDNVAVVEVKATLSELLGGNLKLLLRKGKKTYYQVVVE